MSSLAPTTAPAPLRALTALDDFSEDMYGVNVVEVTNKGIVSVAIPNASKAAFSKAVTKSYKVDLPEVGLFTQSKTNNTRFLGLQQDQLFVLFDYAGDRAVDEISAKVNSDKQLVYLSDQSDSWVTLNVSGENCLAALERICSIDIHPDSFPVGSVARTSMEHMATIIIHESEGSYLLLSLRSFAHSFLHAVTTSIKNVS
ncbi:MAG: sarcosine oxidase subunit gamma family protein [Cocleimonas sp.]